MKPLPDQIFKLAIKDLAKKTICEGHLFLATSEGRKFYVMKPGMYLDSQFLKKHATLNTVFDFTPVTDEAVVELFLQLFKELKYLHFEKDIREKSGHILSRFQELYAQGEHLLSFVLACHKEFCGIPQEHLTKIHETDIHLFRKSIYAGALAVVIGISNDFYHYTMLKDFYNLTLGLDIGLCDKNYSYFVAQACNEENKEPGSGLGWLKSQQVSDSEIQVFLAHPDKSYDFFKSHPQLLAFPELAEVALYQHELSSGTGFPRGITKAQISGWEAVVILADSLFEITDQYNFESDFLGYIQNFQNKKLNQLPVAKVYKRFCKTLQYFKELTGAG